MKGPNMKRSLLLLTFLYNQAAHAETLYMGAQYTISEFSHQWTELGTGGYHKNSYVQGFIIPPGKTIKACKGTQSIKISGAELLVRIICGYSGTTNYQAIWYGNHRSNLVNGDTAAATVIIDTPYLPKSDPLLLGDGVKACWVEYLAGAGNPSPPDSGWELQLLCSAE
jgi:hypothetical protein